MLLRCPLHQLLDVGYYRISYAFGELLSKHHMQPDFNLFIDGDHPGVTLEYATATDRRGISTRRPDGYDE